MTTKVSIRHFRGQDYLRLRGRCLAGNSLFEDPEFPAGEGALGSDKAVLWKRPTELMDEPSFMVDADRFSAVQGDLGDCWFVSALSAVTLNPELLRRVVPKGQSFAHQYAGIFHFRFWQGGEWVDVVVDDRLPVTYTNQLCYSHSSNPAEFWSALLEKAYAKLHGSYSALDAGKCFEATEDLTGGVTERFQLREAAPDDLFSIMVRTSQRGSLLTCSVPSSKKAASDPKEKGLISSHGYCVTGVRRCKVNVPWKSHVDLVRLRNPWGDEMEWRGPWSDNSEEWKLVSADERERLEHTVAGDGEFWMTCEEFKKNFEELYITSLNPQSLEDSARQRLYTLAEVVQEVLLYPEKVKTGRHACKKWEEVNYDGSWVRNSTAGGPPRTGTMDLFSSNPQYLLHLTEADDVLEVEETGEGRRGKNEGVDGGTCTVVISLSQKNRRANKLDPLTVGVSVYKVEEERARRPLSASWFTGHRPHHLTTFKKTRTITFRLKLPPGHYILVPCTAFANNEGDFLLRVFCEKAATMEENDEEAKILDLNDDELANDTVDSEVAVQRRSNLRDVFWAGAGMVGSMGATKLMDALNSVFSGEVEFSLDLARSLLAMMDRDLSGSIDYFEFELLVFSLRRWVDVYNRKKNQDEGTLSGHAWQLGDAFKELGYQVPRRLQGLVVVRYGDDEGNIFLKDFLMATCRISVMLERFRNHSGGPETEQATLFLNDWLQDTLYC